MVTSVGLSPFRIAASFPCECCSSLNTPCNLLLERRRLASERLQGKFVFRI